MPSSVDVAARDYALSRFGVHESLLTPIAAVDDGAIATYIGEVERVLVDGSPRKALLIKCPEPPAIDPSLPIWDLPTAAILRERLQVWVHIAFMGYRRAYVKAFPDEIIAGKVLSHAVNRRVAALMGFNYVRITPVSRGCNSSSSFSEQWGVALHGTPAQAAANRKRGAFIHYADLAALMVMLDLKPGGGIMDAVNEGQALVRPRKPGPAR
jgi:hypothetical protein